MHLWFGFIGIAPALFAACLTFAVIVECASRVVRGRPPQWRAMWLSAVAGISSIGVKHVVGPLLVLPIHLFLSRFAVVHIDMWNPLSWLAIFLARDLISYWGHRLEHATPWLWASHAVHHSFEKMSPSVSTRVPWMEMIYKIPLSLWMPLVGIDIRLIIGIDVCAALISILQHTEAFPAKPNGLLQRVFVVPSHHRVHHGTNTIYLDKNFGAVLCIWDKMFGTFQAETESARYGVLGRKLDSAPDMIWGKYPDLIRPRIEAARTAIAEADMIPLGIRSLATQIR